MKHRKVGKAYLLRLEKGEEVVRSVHDFARSHDIRAATVSAIGAVSEPEIGHFNPRSKSYDRRQLPGDFELVGLMGNISIKEGEPFLHAHVVLGSTAGVQAGHLFRGTISATGEFVITPIEGELERRLDPEVDLPLWNL